NGVDDNCDGQLDEGCDPDTSQALCTAAGKNWLGSGESAPFGGYTAMGALECCGDDSGEYLRITPIPGLGEPVACCNALTDCVDQSAACIASGTVQGAFKCNGGVWEAADGDIDEATCNAIAGTGHWAIGGEISGSACCGDDAGENERFRECSGAACTTLASDKACCNTLTDCVFNDKCYYNVNEALPLVESENTAFCNAFNKKSACTSGTSKGKCFWNDAISPPCKPAATKTAVQLGTKTGTTSFPAYADVDGDLSDEVCIAASPGQWQDTSGSIGGVVMNVTDPVAGAVVRVLGTVFKAMSAVDGSYSIAGLPSGNYDVVAEKDGYEQASSLSLFVPDSGIGVADFTLVHPLGGCEDDCTKVGSNLCDSSCHGKGKCWFSSDGIKAACHNSFGIGYMPDGSFVDCCMGPTYSPIKAVPSVPSDQVIIGRKPILYKGRFVNMVTIVFNK
ncbi:TPA: carboxypeptidase regulatory-like domain-containing protein, partial [Candidatus Woesearchaeota archaeon]|nr:carboxypeptidase regulatory-like domain-containing protein [Candidatus Woesearchaeota archaeon]